MKTNVRLQAIYDMVKTPCIVADVGCDHALLPIMLVKHGGCEKAYACDYHQGPLQRAIQAIEDAGLQEQITPILCDGMAGIGDDVTAVIIAGMGYDNIVHILQQDYEKASRMTQIVIQCNGRVEELRLWLNEHGFTIDTERIVKDSHYYQLLSIHHEPSRPFSQEECLFGIYLRQDPLFEEFWHMMLEKKQAMISQVSSEHEYYKKTQHQITLIKKELEGE